MTRPGIEHRSPGPLANILTARPTSGKHIYNGLQHSQNTRKIKSGLYYGESQAIHTKYPEIL